MGTICATITINKEQQNVGNGNSGGQEAPGKRREAVAVAARLM